MPMGDSNWYYVDGMQNYIWVVLYIMAERVKEEAERKPNEEILFLSTIRMMNCEKSNFYHDLGWVKWIQCLSAYVPRAA
jgi:hypothetical protein